MSSAVGRIFAPAATKSSSGIDEPMPASCWTNTSCPLRTSSCVPAGVIATRYSWFLTSAGMPILTTSPSPFAHLDNPCEPGSGRDRARSWRRPEHRCCAGSRRGVTIDQVADDQFRSELSTPPSRVTMEHVPVRTSRSSDATLIRPRAAAWRRSLRGASARWLGRAGARPPARPGHPPGERERQAGGAPNGDSDERRHRPQPVDWSRSRSDATDLVADDDNDAADVFVRNRTHRDARRWSAPQSDGAVGEQLERQPVDQRRRPVRRVRLVRLRPGRRRHERRQRRVRPRPRARAPRRS